MTRIDLDQQLPVWVGESFLTPEQAERIRRFELEHDGQGRARRSFIAETLGYLGAALALVAIGMIVTDVWDQMEPWGQQVLVALTAALAIGGGSLIRERDSEAVQRLVSVLWAAGVAATAFLAGLLAVDRFDLDDAAVGLFVGVVVTAVALPLYLLRRRPLQQLALAGGVLTLAVASLGLAEASVAPFFFGLVIWAIGVGWALLAWGALLTPRTTGFVIGLILLGIGSQIMAGDEYRMLGLVIAMVTTGGVVAASVAGQSNLLLAFGAAGVFVFVPQLVFELFEESVGAPIALLVAGLLLVVSGVGLARVKGEIDGDDGGGVLPPGPDDAPDEVAARDHPAETAGAQHGGS